MCVDRSQSKGRPAWQSRVGWRFAAASTILLVIPGPTVLLVVSYALGQGWTTFLLLAFANAFGYALIASRARALVQNSRAISVINKAGGTILIGAGVATAAARTAQN